MHTKIALKQEKLLKEHEGQSLSLSQQLEEHKTVLKSKEEEVIRLHGKVSELKNIVAANQNRPVPPFSLSLSPLAHKHLAISLFFCSLLVIAWYTLQQDKKLTQILEDLPEKDGLSFFYGNKDADSALVSFPFILPFYLFEELGKHPICEEREVAAVK